MSEPSWNLLVDLIDGLDDDQRLLFAYALGCQPSGVQSRLLEAVSRWRTQSTPRADGASLKVRDALRASGLVQAAGLDGLPPFAT